MAESAIDWLERKAGTNRKLKKTAMIKGEEFTFWMYPLTIAEQQSANKAAKSDDVTDTGIQLLVRKAMDENGQRMFTADAGPRLRNAVERNEVEKILLAMLVEDEEAPDLDMKSPDEATQKTKRSSN